MDSRALKKSEARVLRALGFNPKSAAFWRCRINGAAPCSRDRVLGKMEAHQRICDAILVLLERANEIAAEVRSLHVNFDDLDLVERACGARTLAVCWNPNSETWEEDLEFEDFSRKLKITEDYSGAPPKAMRKSSAAWRSFGLIFGRPPERLYLNRAGHFAEVRDFRGKVLTFGLDSLKLSQPDR